MTNTSFTAKKIEVRVTLGKGMFGAELGNTKIISGLRTICGIEKPGQPGKNQASLKIYGMLQSDMNSMSPSEGGALAKQKNIVQIFVGDDENGMALAFVGDITEAWSVYRSPPDLYFHIRAITGYYPSLSLAAPKSYKGATSVVSIMSQLAADMGYAFENRNVSETLSSPYLSGSAMQQAKMVADAANLEFGFDDDTLFIAPRNAARKGSTQSVPLISASTGMREYPIFGKKGLSVATLYNPDLKLGGLVKVESVVPNCNGVWRINGLRHELESERPGAHWFTKIKATNLTSVDSSAAPGEGDE